MASPNPDVDAYIDGLPEERREPMRQLRAIVREVAPDADELITYRMPGFKLGDRFLVSFDAFKRHYSLFPGSAFVIAAIGPEIEPHVAGRGTLRFTAAEPLPLGLIRRVVEARLREVDGATPR
jgi:uncharacterized protein YdhG (YjbR/CyaY superfamily)